VGLVAELDRLRFWRRRSRPRKTSPLPRETIHLIRDMAARGRLWGAERIRSELLKLGIKVSKRTLQKYMRGVRGRRGGGQSWATFVKDHDAGREVDSRIPRWSAGACQKAAFAVSRF
jgi:putative transposase